MSQAPTGSSPVPAEASPAPSGRDAVPAGRAADAAPAEAAVADAAPADAAPAEPGPVADGRDGAAGAQPGGRWAAAAVRYAPAGVAAAVMLVGGLWGLARGSSMGNDEVATRWAALLPLRDLAHLLNTVDAVHGLYYFLMHGWVAAGSSPAVLRIPSVAAMVAAVALAASLTRRLSGSGWAGLFAGLVMALTPVITFYAQTARSYAMVMACVLAATLALLTALNAEAAGAPGKRIARRWVAYGLLVALGGYLNELSLLVLVAHAVTVLLARYRYRVLGHWAAAAAVGAALVLPLVIISKREQGAVQWIARPGVTDLRILFQDYFGVTIAAALLVLACAVIALLPPFRADEAAGAGRAGGNSGPGAAPWWRSGGVTLPSVAAPLLVVPAGLLLAESLVATPLYVDRYVLYGEAGAAMLAGAGMYRIGRWLGHVSWPGHTSARRDLLWAPGVLLCVLALVLQLGPQHRVRTPQSREFDFGGPSRYVGANAHRGDGVLFFGTFYRKARLGYPGDFTRTSDFAMAVSPTAAGTFRGRDKPFALIGPLMPRYERIWVIGKVPSQNLPAGSTMRAESAVLGRDFAQVAARRFRGMTVTLWLRR